MLDQANYLVALGAHARQAPILIKGDLERVGQRWQLTTAAVTSLAAEEGDDDLGFPSAETV